MTYMAARAQGGPFRPGQPTVVVIHCTESDNNPGTAEGLAGPNWFGGPAGTSAHWIVDRDSAVQMVKRDRVAYHAGPAGNSVGLSYELCGRAGWSAAKWREPAQLAMLRLAAPLIAADLAAIGAPARWLSVAQLKAGQRGMCTHNDVRLALGGTTHSDPGPNFPYAELLSYVQQASNPTTAPTATVAATNPEDLDMDPNTLKRLVWEVVTQPDVLAKIADAVVKRPLTNPTADPRPGATWSLEQRLPAVDAAIAKLAQQK